jgi:twitching motility protein PilT
MRSFFEILSDAVDRKASDVHFSAGIPPCCRTDGSIVRMEEEPLTPDVTAVIADSILDKKQAETLRQNGEVDLAYSVQGLGRFRVNVFRQRGSLAVAVRILNLSIPSPADLGIPPGVVALTEKKRGLVIVTGPTGSGKSTTLASLIDTINRQYAYHIITLEDPVEYLHRHGKSIVNQREMGSDSHDYASALRAALREDPDVILVGEMRDLETISIAVTAAETGHLVFSTLHTIGAANTIDRIIDVFPPYQQQQIRTQLADVLEGVISQQLLPKKNTGGRVAAIEVMLVNNAVRHHIREAKTFQIASVMQTSRKLGMQTMDDALYDLYAGNQVTGEHALQYAQDKPALMKRIVV